MKDGEIYKNRPSRGSRSRAADSEHDPRNFARRDPAIGHTTTSITVCPISVRVLSKGIDSVYASHKGTLNDFDADRLNTLKQFAQSDDLAIRNQSQIQLQDGLFNVLKRGARHFPYILKDSRFNIQLSSGRGNFPLSYTQISAHYLAYAGLEKAIKELEAIVGELAVVSYTTISRADLYIDITTDMDFDPITPSDFVGRPINSVKYFSRGFEGLKFITDEIILRIYDKTKEIKVSKKEYMQDIWRDAGWDGKSKVYRIEFQINGKALKELGVTFYNDLLARQGSIWGYCTRKWIRMILPGEHSARDRWPTHPLWEEVQSGYGFTPAAPRIKRYRREVPPPNSYIYGYGLCPILAYMAVNQIFELERGLENYCRDMLAYQEDKHESPENLQKFILEKIDERLKNYGMAVSSKDDDGDIPL